MGERLKPVVLKTIALVGAVGSNPTLSAKVIILIGLLFLLTGCTSTSLSVMSTDVLPDIDGYYNDGVFEMNQNVYTRYCDSYDNAKWLKYDKEHHIWKQTRYVTYGCVDYYDYKLEFK